jgi:anti-sigma regulatory factor (Ser/Thr protein kinase)
MVEEKLNLRLAGGKEAPSKARASLKLLNGSLGELRSPVELLVSEIVTNSVVHGATDHESSFELRLRAARDRVRVEVADSGAGFSPPPELPEPGQEGKFGLFLIDHLADRWGVDEHRSTVWFEIDR